MQPWEHTRASRLAGPLGLVALTAALVVALSSVGLAPGSPAMLGPVSVLGAIIYAGLAPLAYVLGAFGLGRPLAAVLARDSEHRMWHQLGLGLALMLSVSHLAGLLGLLSGAGAPPRIAGCAIVGVGLLLLADQVARGPLRPERWPVLPVSAIAWAPALALLMVAASNPPGALWHSEFGAFDALEYHLQLPKEWAAQSRLWPTGHNVYSYLPSYVESAYLHLAALMPGPGDPIARMLGGNGEGNWVIACQLLHALLAVASALLTGRAGWLIARRLGTPEQAARVLGVLGGAFTLGTPWVVVTGSLPYNEMGVIALCAAGVLAALDERAPPVRRAVACAIAVGVACGCKPTTLFLAGPLAGMLLVGLTPRRSWPAALGAGGVAGLASIAPWLVRNAMAVGNPVFPFGTGVFGNGDWSPEQVFRHASNHHAPAGITLIERVSRLVSPEFGLRHEQWGIVLAVLVIGLAVALAWRRSHLLGFLITIGVAIECICWMAFTHLQSRFLITLITPASLLLTITGAGLIAWINRGTPAGRATPDPALPRSPSVVLGALGVLALAPLSQAFRAATIFLSENNHAPNALLVLGVGTLTGMAWDDQLQNMPAAEREQRLDTMGPIQYLNLKVRPQDKPDAGVYLFGDSTPLYVLGAAGDDGAKPGGPASPVIYHTTWDHTLLAAPGAGPATPPWGEWSANLRARGVRYVMINHDELARLIGRDHYYDPGVTLESIADWTHAPEGHLRSVTAWRSPGAPDATGSELFEITLPATQGAAPSSASSPAQGNRPQP